MQADVRALRHRSLVSLAALGGVLLATCIQMIKVGSLRAIARATRSDARRASIGAARRLSLVGLRRVALLLIALLFVGLLNRSLHRDRRKQRAFVHLDLKEIDVDAEHRRRDVRIL